jgi:hypothetical protein
MHTTFVKMGQYSIFLNLVQEMKGVLPFMSS